MELPSRLRQSSPRALTHEPAFAKKPIAAAVGDLYNQHSARVYAICLRMTGDPATAEDLTQEVFIQLIYKLGSFRGESQFSTWLHRLTINQVLMHFRRNRRRKEDVKPDSEMEIELRRKVQYQPAGKVLDRIAIDVAMSRLPRGCRDVLLMFDVEGYKHVEIANIFGCSIGNSKSQLHKARKRMRTLLK
jgi:RNA polymerase sigma-70 factor (ECF subfamily)